MVRVYVISCAPVVWALTPRLFHEAVGRSVRWVYVLKTKTLTYTNDAPDASTNGTAG